MKKTNNDRVLKTIQFERDKMIIKQRQQELHLYKIAQLYSGLGAKNIKIGRGLLGDSENMQFYVNNLKVSLFIKEPTANKINIGIFARDNLKTVPSGLDLYVENYRGKEKVIYAFIIEMTKSVNMISDSRFNEQVDKIRRKLNEKYAKVNLKVERENEKSPEEV